MMFERLDPAQFVSAILGNNYKQASTYNNLALKSPNHFVCALKSIKEGLVIVNFKRRFLPNIGSRQGPFQIKFSVNGEGGVESK